MKSNALIIPLVLVFTFLAGCYVSPIWTPGWYFDYNQDKKQILVRRVYQEGGDWMQDVYVSDVKFSRKEKARNYTLK